MCVFVCVFLQPKKRTTYRIKISIFFGFFILSSQRLMTRVGEDWIIWKSVWVFDHGTSFYFRWRWRVITRLMYQTCYETHSTRHSLPSKVTTQIEPNTRVRRLGLRLICSDHTNTDTSFCVIFFDGVSILLYLKSLLCIPYS